jgi:rubredoxin
MAMQIKRQTGCEFLLNLANESTNRGSMMRKWQCLVCGFIYDESRGLPDDGVAPGTSWDDIPETWQCPECGVTKSEFDMIELTDD